MDNFSSPDKSINHDDARIFIALSEANRLQEAVINTSDLPVLSLSLRGIVTGFNKAAENLLGYTADEVIGTMTFDRFLRCCRNCAAQRRAPTQSQHNRCVRHRSFFCRSTKNTKPRTPRVYMHSQRRRPCTRSVVACTAAERERTDHRLLGSADRYHRAKTQ